jgi:hypothetical protein
LGCGCVAREMTLPHRLYPFFFRGIDVLDNLEQFKDVIEISEISNILKCGKVSAKRIIPIELSFFNVMDKTYVNRTKFYKFLSYVLDTPYDKIKAGLIPEVISMADISVKYGLTINDIDNYVRKGTIHRYDISGLIRYNESDIIKITNRNDLRVG